MALERRERGFDLVLGECVQQQGHNLERLTLVRTQTFQRRSVDSHRSKCAGNRRCEWKAMNVQKTKKQVEPVKNLWLAGVDETRHDEHSGGNAFAFQQR